MKRSIYLYTISCIIILVCACSAHAQVVLNQIMYDTPLNERITLPPYSNGEFIELYNYSTDDVQLYGWQIKGGGKTEIFTFDSIILPTRQHLILAYRHYNTPNFTLDSIYNGTNLLTANAQIVYQRKIILSNEGESVTIWDNRHNKIDSIYYDGTSNKRKEDRLSADNIDSIPYNTCVSLQRNKITTVNKAAITKNADWITDYVGINTNIPNVVQGVDEFYYTPTANENASEHNYVVAVTPLDATSTITFQDAQVKIADNARAAVSITYHDGLGRPIQQNTLRATPQGHDLVTITEYSGLENISNSWNATPFVDNDGQYIEASVFTGKAQQFYNDNVPYTSIIYEKSALRRQNVQQKAGAAWQGKRNNIRYRLNKANEVLHFEALNDTTLVCKGYYAAGTLKKVITTDENYREKISYTDKSGRTIMEQIGSDACTYHVYNLMGQTAYVLPPALSAKLSSGNYTDSHDLLKKYAYMYKYDERGNCIIKRLPGCEPIYMIYDAGKRLVKKQDGNQRARGDYWTIFKYDKLDRIVYTSEVLTEGKDLQDEIAKFKEWNVYETFATTAHTHPMEDTGYSREFYHFHPTKLLTVNYYDNYDFLTLLSDDIKDSLSYKQRNGYDVAVLDAAKTKGRLTGTRVYNLNDNSYTITANYYDINGRLVQQHCTNLLGGTDNSYLAVDFSGNPLRQLTVHNTSTGISVKEQYIFTYDLANRLTTTTYKHNDDVPIILNRMQYDELGRMINKRICNAVDSIQYQYNIQNWLTGIKSTGFEENIYYNQQIANIPSVSNYAYYNGNISATTWTYGDKTNGYIYYYDDKNRFSSSFSILDSIYGDYYYSESITYDKSGNITHLSRWDEQDEMNYLQYTYNGNQVVKITDQGFNPVDYDCKRYMDLADSPTEMAYDANGNLIYDLDRQIVAIRYNMLNLPDMVQFANGNQIINQYDATGNRYRTTYRTRKVAVIVPLGTTLSATDNAQEYTSLTHVTNGNLKYMAYGNEPLRLDYVFNSEGYIRYLTTEEHYPFYYIKDHLGNIRETYVTPSPGYKDCVQRMQYYPSGLPWNENSGAIEHPYRYNGKELVEMHGLDEYDSEARWYNPAIGRTTTMDPLCEQYPNISPYAWCGNNPVNLIDKDGRKPIWNGKYGDDSGYYDDETKEDVSWEQVLNYINWGNYDGAITLEKWYSISSNTINPWGLGLEWLSGLGERERIFGEKSKMTTLLRTHWSVAKAKAKIAKVIKSSNQMNGIEKHDLSDDKGILIFLLDGITLLTLGRLGNLAATFLGSYDIHWNVLMKEDNVAVVLCEAVNNTTARSATRIPKIGYTDWWNNSIGAFSNKVAARIGMGEKTSQKIIWKEVIILE